MDVQYQCCTYGNGALSYFSRYGTWRTEVPTYVRTDGRTESHVTTKIFEIDGLPNFLRYGAPLARQEL